MSSTRIEDLIPGTQKKTIFFQMEQDALWLRGRGSFAEIIEAYKSAGMTPPIERNEPGWWKKKVIGSGKRDNRRGRRDV